MDTFGDLERNYTMTVLLWGRECRDTLVRACEWHKARGAILECRALGLQQEWKKAIAPDYHSH